MKKPVTKITAKKPVTVKKPAVSDAAKNAALGPQKTIKSFSEKKGSKNRKYAHLSCGHKRSCYKTVPTDATLRCRRCRVSSKGGTKAVKTSPVKAVASKKSPVKSAVKKPVALPKKAPKQPVAVAPVGAEKVFAA